MRYLTVLTMLVALATGSAPGAAVAVVDEPHRRPREPATAAPDSRPFVVTYRVGLLGVERGLAEFARTVTATLDDPRGWSSDGAVSFSRVQRDADMSIWLAAPSEIAATGIGCSAYYSCRVGDDVYINADRWRDSVPAYRGTPLHEYRQYVINHEVGHWLGLGHRGCREQGAPARVLQQQSKGLDGCQPQAWPLLPERRRALANLEERGTRRSWSQVHVYVGPAPRSRATGPAAAPPAHPRLGPAPATPVAAPPQRGRPLGPATWAEAGCRRVRSWCRA